MIIISSMQSKISQHKDLDNYHIKTATIAIDNTAVITDSYVKGEKYMWIRHSLYGPNGYRHGVMFTKYETYSDGKKENWYNTTRYDEGGKEYKFAYLNEEVHPLQLIGDMQFLKTNNLWELFIMGLTSKISTEECNGKKCYKIDVLVFNKGYSIPEIWLYGNFREVYYIEKETGLIVRNIDRQYNSDNENQDNIIDIKYEFNNVTDDVFEEPNIEEYRILEN